MKKNIKNKKVFLFAIFICFTIILFIFLTLKPTKTSLAQKQNQETEEITKTTEVKLDHKYYLSSNNPKMYQYLSDIPYDTEKSSVGWGSITLDQNLDANVNNGLITLNIEGNPTQFLKGISAHATSTLIYDISNYNYDYFTTYYGVDAGRGSNGNGVKFAIYTSNETEGENWDLHTLVSPPVLKGNTDALFIKINIKGVKRIKLYAHNNGNATADHSVYADAKLIKEGYEEEKAPVDFIKTLEAYDEIIKSKNINEQLSENELVILQRNFVKNIGYDLLQAYAQFSDENEEMLSWIMNDKDALCYYITGGKPDGSYMNSLKVLMKLYKEYKEDLNNTEVTENGVVLGDLYRRMMVTLSLTHAGNNVAAWYGGNQYSDPIRRYEVYKTMQAKGILEAPIFETLNVEEMRWVMNNQMTDDEIEWLNAYARRFPVTSGGRKGPYNREPYRYIAYTSGYNYSKSIYYDTETYQKWDDKYDLTKYGITCEAGKPKIWIVMEEGGVCGATSKLGSNLNAAFGIPSAVIGQPAHAAYLEYTQNENGEGMWGIQNNISGWTASEKSERLYLGWGSNSWDSYYQVSYVPYAQEAINDIENLTKAQEMLLLIDTYETDSQKMEEIYRKAIEYEPISMDAWYGLITLYQSDENTTEEKYSKLAENITQNLKYFPLPMCDLLNLFKTKFVTPEYQVKFNLLEKAALEDGTVANNESGILQPSICQTMARYLLGNNDFSIASFSFDGEKAGKIVLSEKFQGTTVHYEYSLDGKQTWKDTTNPEHSLTKEELDSINAQDDIAIHLVGASASDIYAIDIKEQNVPTMLDNNDLENKVIGANDTMEWKMNETDKWTSFKEKAPDLTGNKTVIVRIGRTGTFLASPEVTLTYTQDPEVDETRKYIPIEHLSIHSVSSEATSQGRYAKNAIDGNRKTNWHSAWNGSDRNKFIIIKLDEPKYLSALDFVPADGGNGKIKNAVISVSMDGENWTEVVSETNWAYNSTIKSVDFTPTKGQYIKIVGKETQAASSSLSFMVATMFNFYEDVTKKEPEVPTIPEEPEKPQEPEQVMIGDVDGNGKITLNDLVKIKLHCIEEEVLTQERELKAADINGDGKITVTDVAQMKLLLVGLL